MQNQNMILGEVDGEIISLSPLERNQHILILSGKNAYRPRKLMNNALLSQLQSGAGLFFIQIEQSEGKRKLLEGLERFNRSKDYLELKNSDIDNLQVLIEAAMLNGKVLYVEISNTSGKFQKTLLEALVKAGEKLFEVNRLNAVPRHFMVAVDQMNRYISKEWRVLSIFSRRNNISLVTLFDSFAAMKMLLNHDEHHLTTENIILNTKNIFLFPQNDVEENEELSRYFGIPQVSLGNGLIGWYKRKFKSPLLLEGISQNQFIYYEGQSHYVVDLVN